jgi:hypothetical protein
LDGPKATRSRWRVFVPTPNTLRHGGCTGQSLVYPAHLGAPRWRSVHPQRKHTQTPRGTRVHRGVAGLPCAPRCSPVAECSSPTPNAAPNTRRRCYADSREDERIRRIQNVVDIKTIRPDSLTFAEIRVQKAAQLTVRDSTVRARRKPGVFVTRIAANHERIRRIPSVLNNRNRSAQSRSPSRKSAFKTPPNSLRAIPPFVRTENQAFLCCTQSPCAGPKDATKPVWRCRIPATKTRAEPG